MRKATFPMTVEEAGVSATIRRITATKTLKDGSARDYESYRIEYTLLGKRKQEWRSNLDEVKQAASDACKKIANGDQLALELRNGDRMTYLRAKEALTGRNVPLDVACREYAHALTVPGGQAGIIEAGRDYAKRHFVELPEITVLVLVFFAFLLLRPPGNRGGRVPYQWVAGPVISILWSLGFLGLFLFALQQTLRDIPTFEDEVNPDGHEDRSRDKVRPHVVFSYPVTRVCKHEYGSNKVHDTLHTQRDSKDLD